MGIVRGDFPEEIVPEIYLEKFSEYEGIEFLKLQQLE